MPGWEVGGAETPSNPPPPPTHSSCQDPPTFLPLPGRAQCRRTEEEGAGFVLGSRWRLGAGDWRFPSLLPPLPLPSVSTLLRFWGGKRKPG